MYPANGLGQQHRNVNGLDFAALHLLDLVRYGVCDDHLVDGRLVDQARRIRAEQTVRGQHVYFAGAALLERLGGRDKRVNVVDHVVLRGLPNNTHTECSLSPRA